LKETVQVFAWNWPSGRAAKARFRSRQRGVYFSRLQELIKKRKGQGIPGRRKLPKPVKLSVKQVILGLFPENRLIMLADRRDGWHHIMRRDVWLAGCYHRKPALEYCGFVSQNYCSRHDVDGTSYPAFAGIERRWLVIEGDSGSLEQQFWIHKQLAPRCVCWSGGKSLHGWYEVSGWTEEECFQLFAQAIQLGVTDCRNWLISQQARLPGGWNSKTKQKQQVLIWNL
jgi:hypothetical protein